MHPLYLRLQRKGDGKHEKCLIKTSHKGPKRTKPLSSTSPCGSVVQARTQQPYIQRYIRARPGDPLRIGAWEQDLNELASLPVVSRATWRPAPLLPGPDNPADAVRSGEPDTAEAGRAKAGGDDAGSEQKARAVGTGERWWPSDDSQLDLEVLVEEQKKFWNSSVMVGTTTVCPFDPLVLLPFG
jgi:hypothetical protein